MKKQDLATLAMIGISAGLLIGGCQQNQQRKGNNQNQGGSNREQMTPDMQSFYASLSPEAQKKFMSLDAQHRKMAMEMANQSCNGKNTCAGMGGCATNSHSCAGKNGCKGEGGPPVKSSDKAVDVQYDNQTRNNGSHQSPNNMGHSNRMQTGGMNADLSPDMQTFYNKLSPEAQRKFMTLDAQHKMMAIQMTESSCKGKNSCAGMGGCATNNNSCAGKNGCKGQGGMPVKNPDQAVDVQYRNQMQERNQMNYQ